jgi:hypothetical protein
LHCVDGKNVVACGHGNVNVERCNWLRLADGDAVDLNRDRSDRRG